MSTELLMFGSYLVAGFQIFQILREKADVVIAVWLSCWVVPESILCLQISKGKKGKEKKE
jgi:hypothetical protein